MGWIWQKIYKLWTKRREGHIDNCYEHTEPTRWVEMDIGGYTNTKISPMCIVCGENHSKYIVTTKMLGNGSSDRSYCEDCFTVGGGAKKI